MSLPGARRRRHGRGCEARPASPRSPHIGESPVAEPLTACEDQRIHTCSIIAHADHEIGVAVDQFGLNMPGLCMPVRVAYRFASDAPRDAPWPGPQAVWCSSLMPRSGLSAAEQPHQRSAALASQHRFLRRTGSPSLTSVILPREPCGHLQTRRRRRHGLETSGMICPISIAWLAGTS
jgi:hypothetical protein